MNSNEHNIIIENLTDLATPVNVRFPFPLDPRQFFTSKEEADRAVIDAVEIDVTRDEEGMLTSVVIPDEESGGADTVYYFGEPIVVVNEDRTKGTLYIIVRGIDSETGESYGKLVELFTDVLENYYTKEQTDNEITENIQEYINSLDVDTLTDFLTIKGIDACGNVTELNGIYIKGIVETDGKIDNGDELVLLVTFDPYSPYNEKTNPLATVNTVKRYIIEITKQIQFALDGKVDKVDGYGLSQNDFTDCLKDKLEGLPYISLEGNKLIINGRAFMLREWIDIFDYYIGWTTLKKRSSFLNMTINELLKAVVDTGMVPATGKLYGPDTACGRNTFFIMKRSYISFDNSYRGEYSELHSSGISSPIRTNIPTVMRHDDVLINNAKYEVYGLHTYRPNSSDSIQIAFGFNTFDFYIGWINLRRKTHFYDLTKSELVDCVTYNGNISDSGTVYTSSFSNGYNTFIIMTRDDITINNTVDGVSSEWVSNGLASPIKNNIGSILKHMDIEIGESIYKVYGIFTAYPNLYDTATMAFNRL